MKIINQQGQYKQDSRINDIKSKITGMGHQRDKDISQNV